MAVASAPADDATWPRVAQMRTRLEAVIQPKDTLDDPLQIGRDLHRAQAATIVATRRGILYQLHVESRRDRLRGAREDDNPLCKIGANNRQMVFLSKLLNLRNIRLIGAITSRILFGVR